MVAAALGGRWVGIAFSGFLILALGACAGREVPVIAQSQPDYGALSPDYFAVEPVVVSVPASAWEPGAPERYVVRPGDTLWAIARTFLRDPWYWPEIWVSNPQVRNPHRIYPGDVLSIHYLEGKPRVGVVERWSPQMRIEESGPVESPIAVLQPFLFRPQVVDADLLDSAPYIVAAQDDRVLFGARDRVYIRHASNAEIFDLYHVVRRDRELRDPDTGEFLGVALTPIGEAEVIRPGDIATAVLRNTEREAVLGDRLIGFDPDQDLLFDLAPAPEDVDAQIIMLFDAIGQAGRFQAVVLNRGKRAGVDNGQIFKIWEEGRRVRDTVGGRAGDWIELPAEEIGTAVVFRTFDKVAYALLMETVRPVREGYRLSPP